MRITIPAARVNAGMTKTEVAEHMEVTLNTVCNWEKEPYKIPIKKAYELAKLYHCDINDLIFVPSNND